MKDSILQNNDPITQNEIARHIKSVLPVYVLDEVDSTNQYAKTLSDDFALVTANHQSAGKGRMGRTFFSPEGCGIYLSLKVPVTDLYKNVPFITTLASVAVHKAIKELYNITCGIKWVNDLYIDNKKVCGILCEAPDNTHAIIGIGINVYPSSFPEELKHIATHLTNANDTVTRNRLIALIADNLLFLLKALPDTSFMDYYKANSIVLGKNITVIQSGIAFNATATDIDPQGGLIIKTDSGIQHLTSGEVSIRFKN